MPEGIELGLTIITVVIIIIIAVIRGRFLPLELTCGGKKSLPVRVEGGSCAKKPRATVCTEARKRTRREEGPTEELARLLRRERGERRGRAHTRKRSRRRRPRWRFGLHKMPPSPKPVQVGVEVGRLGAYGVLEVVLESLHLSLVERGILLTELRLLLRLRRLLQRLLLLRLLLRRLLLRRLLLRRRLLRRRSLLARSSSLALSTLARRRRSLLLRDGCLRQRSSGSSGRGHHGLRRNHGGLRSDRGDLQRGRSRSRRRDHWGHRRDQGGRGSRLRRCGAALHQLRGRHHGPGGLLRSLSRWTAGTTRSSPKKKGNKE